MEDGALLVVEKDSGLLTVPGKGPAKADCLLSRLQAQGYPEVRHAPHRLDRDTSGLLVLGRTKEATRALAVQFQEKRVEKHYEALIYGWPSSEAGLVELPIGKVRPAPGLPARMAVVPPGAAGAEAVRPCTTRWRVLDRFEADSDLGSRAGGVRCARAALEPLTGRNRQLRLHMAALGHPLLGDAATAREGGGPAAAEAARAWPRLCLHAARLKFAHPGTGRPMEAASVVPF